MHLKYVTTKPKTNSSPPILSGSQKMLTEESENKKKKRDTKPLALEWGK